MTEFAELHAHSSYSFLDGASPPEVLAAEAARLGLRALALTDHDGLYGVVRFSEAAKRVGLPTVFGAELHLPVPAATGAPVLDRPTGLPDPRATHLLVLARGAEGYRRLSSAIGTAHLDAGVKGVAHYDVETLGDRSGGEWLVLTGCRKGALRRALDGPGDRTTRLAAARRELDVLTGAFGRDNVAVEITATGHAHDADLHAALVLLAAEAGLPLVATTAAHYARPSDADLAGALAAVRARSSLDGLDGWLPGAPTAHLRSGAEMARLHARHPEAVAHAARLGAECAFDLDLIAPNLPPHPVPDGHDEASWLRELTYRGAEKHYGSRPGPPPAGTRTDDGVVPTGTDDGGVPTGTDGRVARAWAQIDHELRTITELNFPGYFLVVHDLVEFCRRHGILCQGRGSAANSAVCYALGITAVDAVRHGLLFERFLAPERDGPPDIDLDIESVRREEVIQYVYDRFGRTHAAQVANVITYRPRSAVRDASRALGYDVGQADAWSTSIERWGSLKPPAAPAPRPGGFVDVLADDPREPGRPRSDDTHDVVPSHAPPAAAEEGEIPDDVIDLADRMLRLPRHLGIHSGGMVMCDRPVIEVCPVEWARMPGRTVLQWDKEDCADAGLVKFDLLGLGMLTAIRYAFESIAEHTGERLTLHDLPPEDARVYDLLCEADTVGVFQVESRAQMATLPRLRPRTFYDIVVEVALIRPGPIQGGSVHPYIERAQARARGQDTVEYLHPLLENSLRRTLGVPLFQEQLMQMAIDVAGFTPAESDRLRRAMGSKRSVERMEALRARLHAGMAERGIPEPVRDEIYEKLKAFADFGFPESHAYSFAYLVYASAWLKVHHPAAFYAGLLAAQPMGFYSPQSLAADARRHGVRVLRPDVNASRALACVEQDAGGRPGEGGPALAVRMGLAEVTGIGKELAEEIVRARSAEGFADLRDLVRRVNLGTARIEALATAGALESLGLTRRAALWAAGALGQEGPGTLPGVSVGTRAPELPEMDETERARADAWATGVTPDSYPTQFVRDGLRAAGVRTVAEVGQTEAGRRVAVGGVVTHRQRPGTAGGVTFLSIEDETGLLNVICTPGLWRRFRRVARSARALVVRGRVESADGAVNLLAEHLAPLSLATAGKSRDFR